MIGQRVGHKKSFTHRLGQKVNNVGRDLGKKVHKAEDWMITHSDEIADVAGQVGGVAGKIATGAEFVAKGAETALPFTAEIPIVGEAVAGAAALGETVGTLASGVQYGAQAVGAGARQLSKLKKSKGRAEPLPLPTRGYQYQWG